MRKGTTAKELAKKMGVNIKTVYKYTALPRADYLANSISRAKPWEALGMSRTSWYRKGKPTALPDPTAPPTATPLP
jgi:hypothetical protein